MTLYLAILIPTAVGLWLHRRFGPNRGTALFVIGGLVLGTAASVKLLHRGEQRALAQQLDRALARLACPSPPGARLASFASIDVVVTDDAAIAFGRTNGPHAVRLVDAQDSFVFELRLEGTSTTISRDARARQARTAIFVEGTTVQRVPLRPDARCARG